jgi:polyglutamine-binding protein 1
VKIDAVGVRGRECATRGRVGRVGPMGKIPDALRARLAKRGIEVPTDGDGDGDGTTTLIKRARGESTSDGGEEDALPPGWRSKVDPTYGKTYYYNKTLNKTQWERPVMEKTRRPPPPPKPVAPLPPGWTAVTDPGSGREYFYNQSTQKTSWERPKDAASAVGMKRCAGCGGFGRGLVKEHGYCLHCSRILGRPPPGVSSLDVVENKFMTRQQRERADAFASKAKVEEKKPPTVSYSKPAQIEQKIGPSSQQSAPSRPSAPKKVAARPPPQQESEPLDPMDPSSYSDAPRGGWGRGIEKSRDAM